MRALLIRLTLLAALILPLSLLPSCGSGLSLGVGIGDDGYNRNHRWYRNGDRRGDYVYYRGDWYYQGYGTPYESYFWDPYYDDWYYW